MEFTVEDFTSSPPGSTLTSIEIFRIGYFTAKGLSCHAIGEMLSRDPSTISRTVQKFAPTVGVHDLAKQFGFHRPKKYPTIPSLPIVDQNAVIKLIPQRKPPSIMKIFLCHYLIHIILKDPSISLRIISEMMEVKKFPFALKKTQIGKELHRMHIQSIRRIPIPRMTQSNREYRKQFAAEIQTDFRMLLPWLFTDEASITRNANDLYVKRIPGIIDNDDIYIEKEQFPMRIMVWGAISHNFKSRLIRVEGTINAEKYKEMILQSGVIDQMNAIYGPKAWVFQDDGASAHRARKTRAFLADQCFTLSTDLMWPAHSPDLNVIENLWGLLKNRITGSNCQTTNDLWLQAQAAWDEITIDKVNNLIGSFTNRLRTVEALDGQSLNGHRNIQVMLAQNYTIQQIRQMREEEKQILERFLNESQDLFETEVWEAKPLDELFARSKTILKKLPETILEKVRLMMAPELIDVDYEL